MRQYNEETDQEEVESLRADHWQLDLLKLNPTYTHWGCFEDYMSDKDSGWAGAVIAPTWDGHFELDELNELVNFYFEVYRKNHECPHCKGSGHNPKTYQLSEDWYDFQRTGRRWCDKLTEVEVFALGKAGRLHNFMKDWVRFDEETQSWMMLTDREWVPMYGEPTLPTAAEVNSKEANRSGFGHDAINRWVCIEARAKHLGVWGYCTKCEGGGVIYDDEKATVALQLWYLHPRKGCSRGVYIEKIEEQDLPSVFTLLKGAKDRNSNRFALIP